MEMQEEMQEETAQHAWQQRRKYNRVDEKDASSKLVVVLNRIARLDADIKVVSGKAKHKLEGDRIAAKMLRDELFAEIVRTDFLSDTFLTSI